MLFTESQLGANNVFSILDEATYLTQSESQIQPQTVPVMEVSRLGVVQIPFYAINELADSNGCGLLEAAAAVCSADGIDPQNAVISMTEEEVILYPDAVREVGSIVVSPISSQDETYQFCEACIDSYVETGDEQCLTAILQEGIIDDLEWQGSHELKAALTGNAIRAGLNKIKRNPAKAAWGAALATAASPISGPLAAYGTYKGIQHVYKKYKNRPKSVIAKKIASLRKLYSKWLERAKIERDDRTAGILKRIATNIMLLIDKLLELLQKGADKISL